MKKFFNGVIAIFTLIMTMLGADAYSQLCTTKEADARQKMISFFDTTKTRGLADNFFLWNVGDSIYVQFLDGSIDLQRRVIQLAKTWEQYANVTFVWTTGVGNVRVKFNTKGDMNSRLGRQSNSVELHLQTMNIDSTYLVKNPDYFRRSVIHEFGHALGFLHEHSNPISGIQWNKDTVYADYKKYGGWEKEDVDYQIFRTYNERYTNGTAYDPKSIMHYTVQARHTLNGYSVGINNDLSEGDKELAAMLYPRQGERKNEVPRISIFDYSNTLVKADPVAKGINVFPSFYLSSDGTIGDIFLVVLFLDKNGKNIPATGNTNNINGSLGVFHQRRSTPGKSLAFNKQNPEGYNFFVPYDLIPKAAETEEITVLFRVFVSDGTELKGIYDANPVAYRMGPR